MVLLPLTNNTASADQRTPPVCWQTLQTIHNLIHLQFKLGASNNQTVQIICYPCRPRLLVTGVGDRIWINSEKALQRRIDWVDQKSNKGLDKQPRGTLTYSLAASDCSLIPEVNRRKIWFQKKNSFISEVSYLWFSWRRLGDHQVTSSYSKYL